MRRFVAGPPGPPGLPGTPGSSGTPRSGDPSHYYNQHPQDIAEKVLSLMNGNNSCLSTTTGTGTEEKKTSSDRCPLNLQIWGC